MIAFSGCTKEEIKNPVSETKTVQFVAESIETKTAFGTPDGTTYPTLWTENDEKVKLSLNYANPKDAIVKEKSDDFTTAKFSAEIEDDGSGSYVFYALSPASAYNSFHKENKYLSANISTTQTPLENSVDERAQVLYAISEQFDEVMPSSVSLSFKHFTAYGKLSFVDLELGGAKVTSVAISSQDVNLAGRWQYNVADGVFAENSGASEITLDVDKTENLWFACAPVGSMDGKKMKFTINTDRGTLSKEVTLSGEKYQFSAGQISNMKVSMAGIGFTESIVYELVTDPAKLTVDSKIIIAAKDYDVALSTTQNNNNRGQAAVTKNGDKIENPGDGVQIITVEKGSVEGSLAFNVGGGYLYAASSSSNYLKTQATLSDNSSWLVTIADGAATIVAQGNNARNMMQYNQSSSLFACYGSASQKALAIYKLKGTGTIKENYLEVAPNTIEVEADATSALFTVNSDLEWTATSEDAAVVVAPEGKTVTVTFPANEDAEEKVYTVTVSADDVEPVTVTITQKGYVDPSVIEELTVAEFLAKEVDDNVLYKLQGTITSVANTTYGNFNLTDDTGTVYIYGLCSEDGATEKYWATSGAKLGDDIIICVPRADYNGQPQGKNARFIELTSPGTRAFYTLNTEVVEFASAGGEQVVTVTAYNTDATVTASSDNDLFAVEVDGYNVTVSSEANKLEEKIEGNITVTVGNLQATVIKVSLAAKPASGTIEGGKADFVTITKTSTSYGESKTTLGWTASNCAVLSGGSSDANPIFKMIGEESNRALCMNGKTSAVGKITSPAIQTGCGILTFNYGLPYSDTKIKFRVDVIQNGVVVNTFTIDNASATKLTKYTHKETINVSGEFQIVFTNLSPSNSTSNKDRTAIWDVEWTDYN